MKAMPASLPRDDSTALSSSTTKSPGSPAMVLPPDHLVGGLSQGDRELLTPPANEKLQTFQVYCPDYFIVWTFRDSFSCLSLDMAVALIPLQL